MASELLSNPTPKHPTVQKHHGSCLCTAITYTVTGPPLTTVLCHCTSCKKSSGSLFQANGCYERSQLEIANPSSALKTYKDHSPDAGAVIERLFCGECGSNLFNKNENFPSAIVVASGTLDDEDGLREWSPECEYYCKRRAAWLEGVGAEEGKRFEGMS